MLLCVCALQVLDVLVSLFPLDWRKLEEALPDLWRRWDRDGSGFVSRSEFTHPSTGLVAFVTAHLLHEERRPLRVRRRELRHLQRQQLPRRARLQAMCTTTQHGSQMSRAQSHPRSGMRSAAHSQSGPRVPAPLSSLRLAHWPG